MPQCLVSFGANLGDASKTIQAAADSLLSRIANATSDFKLSRFFRTPPVGGPSGQPPFINAVVAIETKLNVWEMWSCVRDVETEFGRTRNQRWEARPIDIDILLHGDQRIWTPQFKVPHPRMCMRRFILAPAVDVAADWIEPVTGWSIERLFNHVRVGRGSLVVIASEIQLATKLLQEAARQAVADWVEFRNEQLELPNTRWVGVLPSESSLQTLENSGSQQPKLLVRLGDRMQVDGVSWEDFSRHLAIELNLVESQSDNASQKVGYLGPRYLLPSDDPEWAIHELAAALDAMDCPVEPVE